MPYRDPNPFLQSRGAQLAQIINAVGGFQSNAHAMEAQRKLGPSAFGILYGRGYSPYTEDALARSRDKASRDKEATDEDMQQLLLQLKDSQSRMAQQGQQIQGQANLQGMQNQNAIQLQGMGDDRARELAQMQMQQNEQDNMTRLQQQKLVGRQGLDQQRMQGQNSQSLLKSQMGYAAQQDERDYQKDQSTKFNGMMQQLGNLSGRLKEPGKKELADISQQVRELDRAYSEDGTLTFDEYLKARSRIAGRAFSTPWNEHMIPFGEKPDDTVTDGFVQRRRQPDGSLIPHGLDPNMDRQKFQKQNHIPVINEVTGEIEAYQVFDPLTNKFSNVPLRAKPALGKPPAAAKPMFTPESTSSLYREAQESLPQGATDQQIRAKLRSITELTDELNHPGDPKYLPGNVGKKPQPVMGRARELDRQMEMQQRGMLPPPGAGGPPPPGSGGPPPPIQQQQGPQVQADPAQQQGGAGAFDQRIQMAEAAGLPDLAEALAVMKEFNSMGSVPPELVGEYNKAFTTIQKYSRSGTIPSNAPLSPMRGPPNRGVPGAGASSMMNQTGW